MHVEAVELQNMFMGHDSAADILPHPGDFVVGGVDGVDADACENDPVLLRHLVGDVPLQLIQIRRGHGVGHLNMDRAHQHIRAVAVQNQIIGPGNLWKLRHGLLDPQAELAVHPLAEDPGEGLPQHIKAGFQNHKGDHRAEPGLQRDLGQQEDHRGNQGGRGNNRIVSRILAGGDQGIGVDGFPGLLHIKAQGQLHHHRHGDDHQGGCAVVRLFRMDDLLDGLHQGGDTGIQDDDRNDGGGDVLGPAVTVGVLFVRLSAGQLGADDGDDRGQGVGKVVHRVQHHGNGVGQQTHKGLEARQQQVGQDAQNTRPHNDFFSIHFSIPPSRYRFSISTGPGLFYNLYSIIFPGKLQSEIFILHSRKNNAILI